MLEKIKAIPKQTRQLLWSNSKHNAAPDLERLSDSLNRELNLKLKELSKFTDAPPFIRARHLVIDNLTNVKAAIDRIIRLKSLIHADVALALLDEQTEQTEKVLQTGIVAGSSEATEIACRILNLLFCAKQAVKQKFSVITPIVTVEDASRNNQDDSALTFSPKTPVLSDGKDEAGLFQPRLVVSATLLYQLHHSLFPAERMMVGAGRRNGQMTSIDAVFDVTGDASAGYVRANPERLGRALVAMSETDTYFALWIHSHPGRGREASHPSSIDRNQEIDWLRDYSADLVNAIMVEDRYVRFWGKSLEKRRMTVEVAGIGIKQDSENIFRLES